MSKSRKELVLERARLVQVRSDAEDRCGPPGTSSRPYNDLQKADEAVQAFDKKYPGIG